MAFKPHYGYCKFCDKDDKLIVVKSLHCQKCNHELKQSKKKQAGKKTGGYVYKRVATGETSLFEAIAETREWKCFVTGAYLSVLTPTQFMHVLPKALNKYPKMKLYKDNIVLATDEIHRRWDFSPRSELVEPYWKPLFELEAQLKEIYKTL